MAAPTDNGSGPAPIGAPGRPRNPSSARQIIGATGHRHSRPPVRQVIGATGRASRRPLLPPGHDFLLGEADGDVAPDGAVPAFGGAEAVGFWQPFCFAIAVPTSPD